MKSKCLKSKNIVGNKKYFRSDKKQTFIRNKKVHRKYQKTKHNIITKFIEAK